MKNRIIIVLENVKQVNKEVKKNLLIHPLSEKNLIQNKSDCFSLKLTIISGDSKNLIIINKDRYLDISKGDSLTIPPMAFYSIKNLSSKKELLINVQINN
jgi:hypothetical protein